MYSGIFIDDDQERESELANRLSFDEITFDYQPPDVAMVDVSERIVKAEPDIVALDYRLDEIPIGDHPHNRYKAGPLAQQLRDHCIQSYEADFPIVLVSNEEKIRDFYDPDVTAHDLFDAKYNKEDISVDSERIQAEILALVEGYKLIIEKWGEANLAEALFSIHAEDPPLQYQDIKTLFIQKAPHQIANWILRTVLERSGILLNEANLYARLGIDEAGDDLDKLKDILAGTSVAYKGIFARGWVRWWDYQLNIWGKNTCGEYLGNLTAEKRISCLNEKLGLNLTPAKSRWRKEQIDAMFYQACACCKLPTEKEFSVPAYDPVAYSFIQKEIICWDCIVNGRYEDKGLSVDEAGEFIKEKLENGELTVDI